MPADALNDEPTLGPVLVSVQRFGHEVVTAHVSDDAEATRHGDRAPSTSFICNLRRNGFC